MKNYFFIMPAFHTIKLLLCKIKAEKRIDNANYSRKHGFCRKTIRIDDQMIEDSGKFSIPNRSSTVNTSSFLLGMDLGFPGSLCIYTN